MLHGRLVDQATCLFARRIPKITSANDNPVTAATRPTNARRYLPIWMAGAIAVLVVTLDQLTKAWIIAEIGSDAGRRVIDLLPGLRFIFVRNTGSAFGLFQGQGSILLVLVFVAIGFLCVFFYRNARRDPLIALALGLQIGGATGNLIDRLRFGYVVDFIDFPRFPTFNVADSAITIGTTLLIYALLFRDGVGSSEPDVEDSESSSSRESSTVQREL